MITEFCTILGVSESDILGRSRINETSIARHIYFWLMYQSGYSYSEIGRLNGRTHATILNSVKAVNSAIEVQDKTVLDMWDKVKDLRASKTDITPKEVRNFCCPNCNGRGKVIVFEDYLGLEPPEYGDCEVCEGVGTFEARKITVCRNGTLVVTV